MVYRRQNPVRDRVGNNVDSLPYFKAILMGPDSSRRERIDVIPDTVTDRILSTIYHCYVRKNMLCIKLTSYLCTGCCQSSSIRRHHKQSAHSSGYQSYKPTHRYIAPGHTFHHGWCHNSYSWDHILKVRPMQPTFTKNQLVASLSHFETFVSLFFFFFFLQKASFSQEL